MFTQNFGNIVNTPLFLPFLGETVSSINKSVTGDRCFAGSCMFVSPHIGPPAE